MSEIPNRTTVVNVKVKYIRPKYQNLKEWMDDPNNVYIGRGCVVFIDGVRFPKESSKWANPFKISKHLNREESIDRYKKYISEKISNDPYYNLQELKGKNIGCWCVSDLEKQCHGNILVELIDNSITMNQDATNI